MAITIKFGQTPFSKAAKLASITTVATLALGLTACGGQKEDTAADTTDGAAASAEGQNIEL